MLTSITASAPHLSHGSMRGALQLTWIIEQAPQWSQRSSNRTLEFHVDHRANATRFTAIMAPQASSVLQSGRPRNTGKEGHLGSTAVTPACISTRPSLGTHGATQGDLEWPDDHVGAASVGQVR
jgi:hypothetical protein